MSYQIRRKLRAKAAWATLLAAFMLSNGGCHYTFVNVFRGHYDLAPSLYHHCPQCGHFTAKGLPHQCKAQGVPCYSGFQATCWQAWPTDWSRCPPPGAGGCAPPVEQAPLPSYEEVPGNNVPTATPTPILPPAVPLLNPPAVPMSSHAPQPTLPLSADGGIPAPPMLPPAPPEIGVREVVPPPPNVPEAAFPSETLQPSANLAVPTYPEFASPPVSNSHVQIVPTPMLAPEPLPTPADPPTLPANLSGTTERHVEYQAKKEPKRSVLLAPGKPIVSEPAMKPALSQPIEKPTEQKIQPAPSKPAALKPAALKPAAPAAPEKKVVVAEKPATVVKPEEMPAPPAEPRRLSISTSHIPNALPPARRTASLSATRITEAERSTQAPNPEAKPIPASTQEVMPAAPAKATPATNKSVEASGPENKTPTEPKAIVISSTTAAPSRSRLSAAHVELVTPATVTKQDDQ